MHTRDQRHYLNYERFETNKRFEEVTDIAERLGCPIVVTIGYEMHEGSAYCTTDTKARPFHDQTELAKLDGKFKFTGSQAFEYTRLSHEHDEALMVDQLGRGELDGNVLIKYSKIPDAVVSGTTDIKGYRRDLLRHFVRIYYRTEVGVDCKLFTLDKNSQQGTEYAGLVLGLDTSQPSEDLLADCNVLNIPDDPADYVDRLQTMTIGAYDKGVFEESGKITHAGSDYNDQYDAMNVISSELPLVDQHMKAIADIMQTARGEHDIEVLLESARQRTAAAIKISSLGEVVSSANDASVSTEMANNEYGRDCATTTGMNQTQQNMENKWSQGECQVCFVKTSVGSCNVCAKCSAADDRGIDLLKLRDQNLRRLQKAQSAQSIKTPGPRQVQPRKTHDITSLYGKDAVRRQRIVVGGIVEEVRDRRTGDLIAA
ncbi:MAG: hypothetical protein ABIR46_03445 [Candidatus Saccharimonadales bacterium]